MTELRQFLDAVRCVVVHDDTPAGATSAPSTAAHSKAHEEARAIVASQHGAATASQLKFPHVPIDRSLRVAVPSEEVRSCDFPFFYAELPPSSTFIFQQ